MEKNIREKSRTEKVAINASVTTICQIFTYFLNFISRTIFIKTLGVEYLGVNGLFSNILTLLSFAELGIGNAITFYLYKPLANNDEEEIKKIMKLYALIYKIIGCVIISLGLMIIPVLDFIITDAPNIPENLVIIYVLFLLDSAVSYFFTYKATIIIADQKNYIVAFYRQIITVIFTVIRLITLYITKNYIVYLLLQILMTLSINIIISLKADKLYPFIKKIKETKIERDKIKTIFQDAKALVIYKFSDVLINGADNVIISVMLGVTIVGYSSNYTLVTTAVTTILYQLVTSLTATIGNLNVKENDSKSENVFYKIFLICFWIYSIGSVILLLCLEDFIGIWLGNEYILDYSIVLGLVFSFYIKGIQLPSYMYRMTLGLFVESKYVPIFTAILNIVLSVVLCKIMGIGGIFIATGLAKMLTTGIVDPLLIYNKKFKKSSKRYFFIYFKYALIFVFIYFITFALTKFIDVSNIFILILKFVMIFVIFNILFMAIFRKNEQYKECKNILKDMILNKIRRRKNDYIK